MCPRSGLYLLLPRHHCIPAQSTPGGLTQTKKTGITGRPSLLGCDWLRGRGADPGPYRPTPRNAAIGCASRGWYRPTPLGVAIGSAAARGSGTPGAPSPGPASRTGTSRRLAGAAAARRPLRVLPPPDPSAQGRCELCRPHGRLQCPGGSIPRSLTLSASSWCSGGAPNCIPEQTSFHPIPKSSPGRPHSCSLTQILLKIRSPCPFHTTSPTTALRPVWCPRCSRSGPHFL